MCYADDLALLAPSQAALKLMLHLCEQFADLHGLKNQLIRFGLYNHRLIVSPDSHFVALHFFPEFHSPFGSFDNTIWMIMRSRALLSL